MSALQDRGDSRTAYPQHPDHWYVEPPSAVRALLNAVRFRGTIYDPACGGGNIPLTCIEEGFRAFGSDLVYRGFGEGGLNFLTAPPLVRPDNVIMNPPFKDALAFIQRALEIVDHKVAVFIRLAFLESAKRKPFFETAPLSRVLVFSDRVSCPPGGTDIKAEGGKVAYCWLVFDKDHSGPPTVGWL